jgi:hypothetical protein
VQPERGTVANVKTGEVPRVDADAPLGLSVRKIIVGGAGDGIVNGLDEQRVGGKRRQYEDVVVLSLASRQLNPPAAQACR